MENNQRNSKKRLNSLILLVAFTAIMLIVSTYAWFSTQKNVTLRGLEGVVNVAEGLQMSLDAEHWVNTIDFSHFDQTTDKQAWTVKSDSPTTYLNDGATFQTPASGITNVTPVEFLPVSTTGTDTDGIGQNAVKFYNGTNTETIKLMDDTNVVTEDKDAGYFAFDLFLMNTTSGSSTEDQLQLDPISDIIGQQESTGVQNTARIGFALYNNDSANMGINGNNPKTPAEIIAGASTGKTIKDFAIWEPNANSHTDTIVASLSNSIKLDATELSNWTDLPAADATTKVSKFSATSKIPTFALTSTSVPGTVGDGETVHIADVYDWRVTDSASTAAKGVKKQWTLQTDSYTQGSDGTTTMRANPVDLVSATDGTTQFKIAANQYQKIRVYVWMEGQDPDCINAASLGGGLRLDLGFSKPGTVASGS